MKGKKPFAALPFLKLEDSLGVPGEARVCCIWSPKYSLIAEPLHETLKGNDDDPL